ncbi:hypothetical protein, partial [uncultured Lamprocystis sp.]
TRSPDAHPGSNTHARRTNARSDADSACPHADPGRSNVACCTGLIDAGIPDADSGRPDAGSSSPYAGLVDAWVARIQHPR